MHPCISAKPKYISVAPKGQAIADDLNILYPSGLLLSCILGSICA